MIPAQLVRALGQAARLTGCAERQAELVALEERASLDHVVELLDEILNAVDQARPAAARAAAPRRERSGPGGYNEIGETARNRILELVRAGRTNEEIAAEVGCSVTTVSRTLRRAGVPPRTPQQRRVSKIDEVRALHRKKKTNAEIAAATGLGLRSVGTYLSRLGLRGHRPPDVEDLDDE